VSLVKQSDCVAYQIEGHVGEPVDGGDNVEDQHERVCQAGDDAGKRKW